MISEQPPEERMWQRVSRRELFDKIEKALEMVIAVSGRKFRIVRDEEDMLTISEGRLQETGKRYSDTNQMMSRYRIDGNPLRDYIDTITIEKYVALLDV